MNVFRMILVQYDTTEPDNAGDTELAVRLINEAKCEKAGLWPVRYADEFAAAYLK